MKMHLLLLTIVATNICSAQFLDKLKNRIEDAAERTVEKRVEKETEKKTDKAMDKVFEDKKPSNSSNSSSSSSNNKSKNSQIVSGSSFFPEGQVLFLENFSQDNFGDFPANWETNSGGEIIKSGSSKALRMYPNGTYLAKLPKLPENYALEFDLITENLEYDGLSGSQFGLVFSNEKTLNKPKVGNKFGFSLWRKSTTCNQILVENWGNSQMKIDNKIPFNIQEILNTTTHFTIVVNKTRMRLYIDGEKAIDLPSLLSNGTSKFIQFYLKGTDKTKNHIVAISNIKITEEGEDIRSMILKGGFSTTKILFDPASDKIKKESYEYLDKIATVLQADKSIKLSIIGHTDSDGEDAKNMTLSKSRAEAVKNYLVKTRGLSESRFITQGKGESEPVAENKTNEGKAKNRRVEFKTIK